MSRFRLTLAASSAALALALVSCSDDEKKEPAREIPTQAEVAADVVASTGADSDGAGLPDDVERRYQAVLGCDPTKADTDGDGVNDGIEVLGASWLWVTTEGQSGAVPGATLAGGANDADVRSEADSDEDGVADHLEVAGYRYDVEAGRFVEDRSAAGFRTDPLQWSSDQDAYSDGQEVSGINMDVAVRAPGTHPLVPAYPDITVELMGYSVALTSEITYGEGGSLSKETNWSRQVERSHSLAEEVGVEVKVGASLSGKDLGFSGEVTTSLKVTNTDTTTVSTATGGSVTDESNWSVATTEKPSEAAAMKLHVKVRNRGTAPASNVVPTLSLRVGGADVATFEPPSLSVASLLPGAAFPPDPTVAWVIDSVSTDRKLYLTDWELRALESRAPVSLGVAQKRADVMRLEDGKWTSVGDAGEFLARIVSTSADIFADVGAGADGVDGNLIHTRVAADDAPTAPIVTLGDALRWSMNFRVDGDHYAVDYREEDGTISKIPLTGKVTDDGQILDDGSWRWQLDGLTLALNGHLDLSTLEFEDILALKLHPGSRIGLRAPRRVSESKPIIHSAWATSTPRETHVVVCASDYDGLAGVWFVAPGQDPIPLDQDGRGPYFYSKTIPGTLAWTGQEKVLVASTRKIAGTEQPVTADRDLRLVYTFQPKPAVVEDLVVETVGSNLTRLKVKTWSPTSAVTEVRLFDDKVLVGAFKLVDNLFEEPDTWEWKPTAATVYKPTLQRVVVTTAERLYTFKYLSEFRDFAPYKSGELGMGSQFDWTGTPEWWLSFLDVDHSPTALRGSSFYREAGWSGNPDDLLANWKWAVTGGQPATWTLATHGLADLYLLNPSCVPYLGFFQRAMPAPEQGEAYFKGVNRKTIKDALASFTNGWLASARTMEAVWSPGYQRVFFFETPEGRLGKLLVTRTVAYREGWPYEYCQFSMDAAYAIYAVD